MEEDKKYTNAEIEAVFVDLYNAPSFIDFMTVLFLGIELAANENLNDKNFELLANIWNTKKQSFDIVGEVDFFLHLLNTINVTAVFKDNTDVKESKISRNIEKSEIPCTDKSINPIVKLIDFIEEKADHIENSGLNGFHISARYTDIFLQYYIDDNPLKIIVSYLGKLFPSKDNKLGAKSSILSPEVEGITFMHVGMITLIRDMASELVTRDGDFESIMKAIFAPSSSKNLENLDQISNDYFWIWARYSEKVTELITAPLLTSLAKNYAADDTLGLSLNELEEILSIAPFNYIFSELIVEDEWYEIEKGLRTRVPSSDKNLDEDELFYSESWPCITLDLFSKLTKKVQTQGMDTPSASQNLRLQLSKLIDNFSHQRINKFAHRSPWKILDLCELSIFLFDVFRGSENLDILMKLSLVAAFSRPHMYNLWHEEFKFFEDEVSLIVSTDPNIHKVFIEEEFVIDNYGSLILSCFDEGYSKLGNAFLAFLIFTRSYEQHGKLNYWKEFSKLIDLGRHKAGFKMVQRSLQHASTFARKSNQSLFSSLYNEQIGSFSEISVVKALKFQNQGATEDFSIILKDFFGNKRWAKLSRLSKEYLVKSEMSFRDSLNKLGYLRHNYQDELLNISRIFEHELKRTLEQIYFSEEYSNWHQGKHGQLPDEHGTLGGYLHLLKGYRDYPSSLQNQIDSANVALHKNRKLIKSLLELPKIRNRAAHTSPVGLMEFVEWRQKILIGRSESAGYLSRFIDAIYERET